MKKVEHKLHHAAYLFPWMDDETMQSLVESIKQHGLLTPITLFEGMILDGKCRQKACELAGVTPTYRTYEGDDPYAFVMSCNYYRKHRTPEEIAAAKVIMREMKADELDGTAMKPKKQQRKKNVSLVRKPDSRKPWTKWTSNKLAAFVEKEFTGYCQKLRALKPQITALQIAFRDLLPNQTIAGCHHFDEFCVTKLHRAKSTVYGLLAEDTESKAPARSMQVTVGHSEATEVPVNVTVIKQPTPTPVTYTIHKAYEHEPKPGTDLPPAARQGALEHKRLLIEAMNTIRAATTFIRMELDLSKVHSVCTSGEKLALIHKTRVCVGDCADALALITAEIEKTEAAIADFVEGEGALQ